VHSVDRSKAETEYLCPEFRLRFHFASAHFGIKTFLDHYLRWDRLNYRRAWRLRGSERVAAPASGRGANHVV